MKKIIKKGEYGDYELSLDNNYIASFATLQEAKQCKTASIYRDTTKLNICKKKGIAYMDIRGEWNGYGCPIVDRTVTLVDYKKILKELKGKKIIPSLTDEQKQEKWCKRLSKLAGISLIEAKEIAEDKIDYKEEKIREMEERQADNYSTRRASLIRQMERANPLRRIEDEEHAQAIISASNRHRYTNYEYKLDEARDEAMLGNIDRADVRDYARTNSF